MDIGSGYVLALGQQGRASLREDEHGDLLIVGGGITGALCAYACMKAGIRVVVIDASMSAFSSTRFSTGLLQYELDMPLGPLADMIGLDKAVRVWRRGQEAIGEMARIASEVGEASLHARTSIQFASRPSHAEGLRREHALRVKNGFDVELLDKSAVQRVLPTVRTCALRSEGAEVDPASFAKRLLDEVVKGGGKVYEHTEMVGWKRQGQGYVVTTRRGGAVHASHLVMATGYHSEPLLQRPVMDLASTYVVASQPMDPKALWEGRSLIWETGNPYIYLRTTSDHRMVIGGADEPFRDPRRRDQLMQKKVRHLLKRFGQLMPGTEFVPAATWCGTFGGTRDGLPYIDRDPGTGAWFILGMGGNGIVFSQVGARIVRDQLLGRVDPDAELFRFERAW